jgi:putative ABC transport system permease protein
MRILRIAGFALEGLRRNPLRVTLTTVGVTIAGAALVSLMALALGIQRQVEAPFKALGLLNNIQVKPKDNPGARNAPPLDDDALARIEKLPGVAVAYPDVHLKGIKVRHGNKEETAIGAAVPREVGLLGVEEEFLVAGRFFDEGSQPEAILGARLLPGLGFKTPQEAVGAQVTLEAAGLAPTSEKSFDVKRTKLVVTVVGVYDAPPLLPSPAHSGILLPVELMKQIPGLYFESAWNRLKAGITGVAPGYASATVRVRDPADLTAVARQVEKMGFSARTMLSRLQGMRKFFIAVQLLLTLVGSVAMLIAALGIVNTLLMSVLERYQEIGICKAIGASDGDVFVLFLTEAGMIGLLGGISGLALGSLVCWGLGAAADFYARSQDVTQHLDLFAFPPWLLAATVLFAIVVSMVAGIYPALRAARVDPIRALRSQ